MAGFGSGTPVLSPDAALTEHNSHYAISDNGQKIVFETAEALSTAGGNADATVTRRHRLSRIAKSAARSLNSFSAGRGSSAFAAAVAAFAVVGMSLSAAPAQAAPGDPFGLEIFSNRTTDINEAPYTRAGGHPDVNVTEFTIPLDPTLRVGAEQLSSTYVKLPLGFIGNPAAAPRCLFAKVQMGASSQEGQDLSKCPPGSRIGTATVRFGPAGLESVYAAQTSSWPLYNLVPEHGYPAQFGFPLGPKTVISAFLLPRTESYGVTVGTPNVPAVNVTAVTAALCSYGANYNNSPEPAEPIQCKSPAGFTGSPFLSNPVDCSNADPAWSIALDSAEHAGAIRSLGIPDLSDPDWKTATDPAPPVTGCADLVFDPSLETTPLQGPGPVQADQPTGLRVALDFPQTNDPTDTEAESDPNALQTPPPKDITVKLPAGLAISPSSADGLGACSDQASDPAGDQVHYDNTKPVKCPDASKIGTATALSPLLAIHDPVEDDLSDEVIGPDPIPGAVYLLKPHPGDLPLGGGNQEGKFRLLIQLENPRYGVNIKLPGIATADPKTGQLSATFTQNPQLPASHITVNLKEGPRAPLATPVTCGGFGATSDIVPWSTPGTPDAHPSASFNVSSGPNGTPCPLSAANRPFAPAMSAGTEFNGAGQSSPLGLHLTRQDGEQELSSLEATMPKGLAAKFAGIPYCSEAALATAASRSGQAEQANPTCPASRIGSVTAGIGPGATPFYAHGSAYLSGPYKGAPLSVAAITPAVAGPLDLGTAVVRTALFINPETAQGHVVTDPFPTILDGIPLRLRSIDVRLDRPNFTLNPTNCEPLAVQTTILSTDGASSSPSSSFQVGDCKALGFKPRLSLALKGGTKRSSNPALTATVTYPKGSNANIAFTSVTLPHSEFLDNAHIRSPCTRVVFAEGLTPGERCPASSVIGFARAQTPLFDEPLEGPVYLRSSSHKLPDVVAALAGQIFVELDGRIDAVHARLRTTFENVPDAPVSKFTLSLFGDRKGLLVNSENLCRAPQVAGVKMIGHNGKVHNTKPLIGNECKKSKKSSRRRERHR